MFFSIIPVTSVFYQYRSSMIIPTTVLTTTMVVCTMVVVPCTSFTSMVQTCTMVNEAQLSYGTMVGSVVELLYLLIYI